MNASRPFTAPSPLTLPVVEAHEKACIHDVRKKVYVGLDGVMDQGELHSLLSTLDPVWSPKKVNIMTQEFQKDNNGRFSFEEFLEWCYSDYANRQSSNANLQMSQVFLRPGDKVRVVTEQRPILHAEEKVVKVVGKEATVMDPNCNNRVKVMLEDVEGRRREETFFPFEVELVRRVEEQLQEHAEKLQQKTQDLDTAKVENQGLKIMLENEMQRRQELEAQVEEKNERLSNARVEMEKMEDQLQEGEKQVEQAEEKVRQLEVTVQEWMTHANFEQAMRQDAEDRAQRAAQALEMLEGEVRALMAQASLDKEQRQKAEEEMMMKMAEEEKERLSRAEEEERIRKQRQEEYSQQQEESRRQAEEEARLRAEAAEEAARAKEAMGEPPGPSRTKVRVRIVKAQNLRVGDIGGSSDPYCIVHIAGKKEDAGHPPFKTDVKPKTLCPVWDQSHTFDACKLSDNLLFEVMDKDSGTSDDFLGQAVLDSFSFRPQGFEGWLHLSDKKKKKGQAVGIADGEPKGQALYVQVDVLPMTKISGNPRCFVKLLSANNLRSADRGGKSDPFCVCEVPGKPMSRFQTDVKKKTLNPEWKEECEMNDYAEGDSIQVSVFDWDRFGSTGDPLGTVVLDSSRFDPDGFTGTVTLQGNGANSNSTLTLLVDVF